MSTTTTHQSVPEFILEWWHILVFAGSLVVGFILGTARQKWNQEQLQTRVSGLEARLATLEKAAGLDSRALLVLQTESKHIREALDDIKKKLEEL